MSINKTFQGDTLEKLKQLPEKSIHCCITSPPYWGLRDYGVEGQIGLEKTPEEYVSKMVEVFQEVKRVLRDDATLWLNLGDSYAAGGLGHGSGKQTTNHGSCNGTHIEKPRKAPDGLKQKDLVGIPWRVAFALQSDGWYLRQDIIWHKPNPMPESVTDRCTKAHEYIFLLSKSKKYYFDHEAIKEEAVYPNDNRGLRKDSRRGTMCNSISGSTGETRNKRSVWTVATKPFKEAHFATFPPDLILPCVLAGCPEKTCPDCGAGWDRVVDKEKTGRGKTKSILSDGINERCTALSLAQKRQAYRAMGMEGPPPSKTLGFKPSCKCGNPESVPGIVLDPFSGAGTTVLVAKQNNRQAIGIELNPEYVKIANGRL